MLFKLTVESCFKKYSDIYTIAMTLKCIKIKIHWERDIDA